MLQAGFIALTIVLAILIHLGVSAVLLTTVPEPAKQRRLIRRSTGLLLAWLLYIGCISLTGIFTTLIMPPRIPLLLVLPTFIFMGWFFLSGRSAGFIAATPLRWITGLQSFRIVVELLLWAAFFKNILPKAATFEGYNFDILMGLTAPLMARFAIRNERPRNALLLLWNLVGLSLLGIVVFIILSHVYLPSIWRLQQSILPAGIGAFPYTYLAGFFMPLAVFLHIFSIVKIARHRS